MTEEEKQLLFKDLCGRLPYNVKVKANMCPRTLYPMDVVVENLPKPYLRPMSSMSEEEEKEFVQFHCVTLCPVIIEEMLTLDNESNMFDWLKSHHFDYIGLIKKGLALVAPEDMYN